MCVHITIFILQVKSTDVKLISVLTRQSTPPLDSSHRNSFPNPRKISLDHIPMRGSLPRSQSPSTANTTPSINTSIEKHKSVSCDSSPVSSRKSTTPPSSLNFTSPKRRSNGILPDRGSSSYSLLSNDDTISPSDMKLVRY